MKKRLGWLPALLIAFLGGALALTTFVSWGPGVTPAEAATPRTSFKPLNLPPQLPTATGYIVENAFASGGKAGLGFDEPICTAYPPGEKDRIFVVSKTGIIEVISNLDAKDGPVKRSTFMDIRPYLLAKKLEIGQEKEWGILGLAFHPNFKQNGYFYITYNFIDTEPTAQLAFDRLARFSVSKTDPNKADMTSELPLITQDDQTPNHNGGCIAFGDDGYLYYSMGDDGYPRDQQENNARWVDRNFFAAIYRLDVDRKPENIEPNPHSQPSTLYPSAVDKDKNGLANYKIPADNPLIGITTYMGTACDPKKVRTEIFAHGLRNPWRFSFDSVTGKLFEGDVGEDTTEEINIITKGGDYGWPYREGSGIGVRAAPVISPKFTDPIFQYPHSAGNNCITGGFVYHGTRLAELNGAYIFADYNGRHVWALKEKDGKWNQTTLLTSSASFVASIAPDPRNGDILLTSTGPGVGQNYPPAPNFNGVVLRIVRAGTQGPNAPALLSQVGAFADLKTLAPAPGVTPYEPNVTFWSDYALKSRFFIIPNAADTITFDPTGNWKFPTGMIWVKHFDIETTRGDPSTKRRLETRFLVKTNDNVYGITYKWRPDNSDADLVPEGGQDEVLTIMDHGVEHKQTWHYPSQSECLVCHTPQAGGALGFNTWQLNGNGKTSSNQLLALAHAGYFAPGTTLPDPQSLGAYAKADDTSASLEWRVRSYLAVNCVQCHQPGGQTQGVWDARPTTPLANAGILNGPVSNPHGDPAAKTLAPGDETHSMILRRLQANDAPRMPPLATAEFDLAAQKLIKDYIASLKK